MEKWALVAGFLSPPFLALIQQQKWSDGLRASVTFAFSLLLAVITVAINGEWRWDRWIETALTILTVAIATYKGFWHPTNIAPEIEHRTSPKPKSDGTTVRKT